MTFSEIISKGKGVYGCRGFWYKGGITEAEAIL